MSQQFFIRSIIILFVFVFVYELLYRWRPRFLFNRIYLIIAVISSFVLPFVSLKVFPYKVIISGINKQLLQNTSTHETIGFDVISGIYWLGFGLSLLIFIYKIIRLIVLIRSTHFEKYGNYFVADKQADTFSFFNYIFIKDIKDNLVLEHELVHAKKFHSLDIVFFEIFKILMWFNPFLYRIKFYARENHEFEADFIVMNRLKLDNVTMAQNLLDYLKNNVYGYSILRNNFFSLIKNRINMLAKNKKPGRYAYFMVIPIFLLVFSITTFRSYPVYAVQPGQVLQDTLIPGKIILNDSVIVIDENTYKETLYVVKTEVPLEEYVKNIKLSGKNTMVTDSIIMIDPNTYKKSINVKKYEIPVEFKEFYDSLSLEQQDAIKKFYGSPKK